ncbi:hypothetical protein BJ971_004253 [Actinoplanes digitatis]|uniref:Uncharacterized protein n=1 Tax=Actinoplanes digitatis TaxID=1868 RepID=A0A7W7HZK5_9ACTN|nr:hypothetical protein [Actinoplanes digitatis]
MVIFNYPAVPMIAMNFGGSLSRHLIETISAAGRGFRCELGESA